MILTIPRRTSSMTVVNVVKIAGRSPRARAREGRPPKSGQNRQKPEKTDPKPEKTEPHMRIFQNRIKRTKHINHENYPTLSGGVSTKMTKMTKMAKMTVFDPKIMKFGGSCQKPRNRPKPCKNTKNRFSGPPKNPFLVTFWRVPGSVKSRVSKK